MPLIAHLGGGLGSAGHFAQLARLGDIVAQRFLAIDGLAQLHGDHGRRRVLMVGCRDENGINPFADFVEHPSVICENLQF
jgi:hypothetical protein